MLSKLWPVLFSSACGLMAYQDVYASGGWKEIPAPVERIHVPNHLTAGATVHVAITGKMPSLCHKMGRLGYEISEEDKIIKVRATLIEYEQNHEYCTSYAVPFVQKLALGALSKGSYRVEMESDPGVSTSFKVGEPVSPFADHFLLPPINWAFLQVDKNTGKAKFTLRGFSPPMAQGQCLDVEDVRVDTSIPDMIVVTPMAKIIEGEKCRQQRDPAFTVTKALKNPLKTDTLLYVNMAHGDVFLSSYSPAKNHVDP